MATGTALMDILHLPRSSGVYVITCLVTGKRYVGSSRDIRERLRKHRARLRRGDHPNAHLQSAWSLYGEAQFKVEVLEHCAPECVLDREQSYLDTLRTWEHDKGFNNASKAAKAGTTYTMPAYTTENLKRYLAEHKEERVAVAIERQGRTFRLMAPDGTIHEGKGVKALCRKYGLVYGNLMHVLSGRANWCQGWRLPETPDLVPYKFIDPFGVEHTVPPCGLAAFCRERGLSSQSLGDVWRKERESSMGWCRYDRRDLYSIIVSPTGEEHLVCRKSPRRFAEKHGLAEGNLRQLFYGQKLSHRGWRLKQPTPS